MLGIHLLSKSVARFLFSFLKGQPSSSRPVLGRGTENMPSARDANWIDVSLEGLLQSSWIAANDGGIGFTRSCLIHRSDRASRNRLRTVYPLSGTFAHRKSAFIPVTNPPPMRVRPGSGGFIPPNYRLRQRNRSNIEVSRRECRCGICKHSPKCAGSHRQAGPADSDSNSDKLVVGQRQRLSYDNACRRYVDPARVA